MLAKYYLHPLPLLLFLLGLFLQVCSHGWIPLPRIQVGGERDILPATGSSFLRRSSLWLCWYWGSRSFTTAGVETLL